ncbi:MAG: transcriptional repressor, partial [Eubacteriales bacterium]|nr:transcriptional repressor [Eubacteriales bacterium]
PIGASTVYRLLGVLTDEGHIRRFTLGRGKTFYYQYVGGERCGTHLHLKCIVCGRLFHLAGCVSDFMQKQILATSRFALDESQTILFGTCAACRGES